MQVRDVDYAKTTPFNEALLLYQGDKVQRPKHILSAGSQATNKPADFLHHSRIGMNFQWESGGKMCSSEAAASEPKQKTLLIY